VFASGLSLALAPLLLKALTGLIPSGVKLDLIAQPGIALFLVLLAIVVTGLAGFYPAIVLSRYKPVEVLKNGPSKDGSSRKSRMRKTLTVVQFTVAQAFIMGALVVSTQIHYLLNTDIGYKKDAVLYFYLNANGADSNRRHVLLDRLKNVPDVTMASLSNDPPTSTNQWSGPWGFRDGKRPIETQLQMKFGDTGYLRLYGMRLLAGQNLVPGDTLKDVLINESYSRILGFATPQEAVGKWLDRKGKRVPITGVVADFHTASLHEQIKPLVIYSRYADEYCVNVRLSANNGGVTGWRTAIDKIAVAFKAVYPEQDIDYRFLDNTIAQYYNAEQDIAVLMNWATGLAVVISCMGLLGLVIYSTNSRTKEIGVRKILGASAGNMVGLLSADFVKLVGIAFLIAMPLAWWAANQWLSGFPYRTSVSWWMFALTGAGMLVLALMTLSVRVIRAALANPVKSLRTE
ncbi:MAG TPA: FtsX-like permease family protein, partial [Puia sp.]